MSTLCRAKRKWQKHGGAEKSESSCFCPTHFSAFQKRVYGCRRISDNPKNFGNISEKQPFSEIISDLFFSAGSFYRAAAARRRTRSLGGASRPALPLKDVFGGTPDTARETHALPIHLFAFLNDPQGNQTERIRGSHSFPECLRGSPDDFFCRFHFSARLIFLPSIRQAGLPRHLVLRSGPGGGGSRLVRRSRCGEGGCGEGGPALHSHYGDGGSHRVAVSRSDFWEGLGNAKTMKISVAPGRCRSSVNQIEEKIKKCQKCQNPCNSGLNPIFSAYHPYLAFLEPRTAFGGTGLDFSRSSHGSRLKKFSCALVKSCLRQQHSRLP
jgi:hypothetical protein